MAHFISQQVGPTLRAKLHPHKYARCVVVCKNRLEGADTIKQPSACHQPSLASFHGVRITAELKSVTFFSVNRNCFVLRHYSYPKAGMESASRLKLCTVISFLLFEWKCRLLCLYHPRWSVLVSRETCGWKVTYLKNAATGTSYCEFFKVFASQQRQRLSFVSALMVISSCERKNRTCWSMEREREQRWKMLLFTISAKGHGYSVIR